MKHLILDTAHRRGYAACGDLHREGFEADQLSSVVSEMLSENGWSPRDLDLVMVGVGPGSFTGVRVGAAFAKGLNLATGVPLMGYCSLAAYPVVSLFDARAGGVYLYDGKEARSCGLEELRSFENLFSVDFEVINGRVPGLNVKPAEVQWEALKKQGGEPSSDGTLALLYLKGYSTPPKGSSNGN